ncbi:TNF receptor-associated factor 6-like isoform X2 [Dermacentor variabilis]|uniref:TNF receptor-associated factor 6-like isoform X2 n=1 Tax=Dermacentor variabilis TaxID=34621 RepID=UPI003F5B97CB
MRVDVEYRGLPGGTHKLRFADELPRHVMCGTCGMLSMQMYEDEQRHAFCNVCVCLGSPAAAIFCKYENRNVPVDQLIEAFDIIQVIKDQVVYCPNEEKGCPVYTPLCRIEDHYLQCEKTEIECLQCQQRIKGCDWKSHSRDCPRKIVQCRFCVAAFPQIDLQTHEALCAENPNCMTSPTVRHSYTSKVPPLPVPAQKENGSGHVSFSSTELDLPSDAASDADAGQSVFWSLKIGNLLKIILTCVSIVGNFPLVSFLRRNLFAKNFGLPLLTIICIALLVRRRGRQ